MEMGQIYLMNINEIINYKEIIIRNSVELGLYDKDNKKANEVNIHANPRLKLYVVELTYFMILKDSLTQEMEKLYKAFRKRDVEVYCKTFEELTKIFKRIGSTRCFYICEIVNEIK